MSEQLFICPTRLQGNKSFKCVPSQLQKIIDVVAGVTYFVCPNPRCRDRVARDTQLHQSNPLTHEQFEAKIPQMRFV